ncbi:MAG: CDP-diacylglycerol--glycerol-3-phosphate 3-phosphatidyltransferase [Alphaproteobacteria bacterium]
MQKLPNILTIIRILLIPIIVLLMVNATKSSYILAFILYTIACITDWFDGFLARKYNLTSSLGALLDTIADKLLVITMLLALVGVGLIKGWGVLAVGIIILREVIMPALRQFLSDYQIDIPASMIGKVKTTVQMIALGVILIAPYLHSAFSTLGLILLWLAAILTLWSATDYFYQGLRQFFAISKKS